MQYFSEEMGNEFEGTIFSDLAEVATVMLTTKKENLNIDKE